MGAFLAVTEYYGLIWLYTAEIKRENQRRRSLLRPVALGTLSWILTLLCWRSAMLLCRFPYSAAIGHQTA